jgi:hypothetical protein
MISKNNETVFYTFFCFLHYMQAQEKMVTDTSFETARNLAFKKNEQAQDRHIITKYTDYHDIRTFLLLPILGRRL